MSKPCNFGMLGDPRRLNLRENQHAHGSRNAPPALGAGRPKDATSIIMPGSGHLWLRISGARFALVVVRGLCFLWRQLSSRPNAFFAGPSSFALRLFIDRGCFLAGQRVLRSLPDWRLSTESGHHVT